jgi:hypothetical protein
VGGAVMGAIREADLQVQCRWCGMSTPLGVTCRSCGSSLDRLDHCRYCRALTSDSVCPGCQEALIRLWRIAQESPDSRFLFADVL